MHDYSTDLPRSTSSRKTRLLSNRSGNRDISAGVNQWTDSTSAGFGLGCRVVAPIRPPPGQLDFPGGDALPEPPRRTNGDAKFLADLADKGFRFAFARFDPSAGKAVGQRGNDAPGAANDEHLLAAEDDCHGPAAARIVGYGVHSAYAITAAPVCPVRAFHVRNQPASRSVPTGWAKSAAEKWSATTARSRRTWR